ncbi:MAG TPA: hypothetical protein VF203_03515 [Burkholderiales bacterium]
MFLALLGATFIVALAVSGVVMRAFNPPIDRILKRIIADDISEGWLQYVRFAILVVGVSAGVRVYDLERYINPNRFTNDSQALSLTRDRWVLEVYRTVIETLQGIAWLLLCFFAVALIAYVIVRVFELRREKQASGSVSET